MTWYPINCNVQGCPNTVAAQAINYGGDPEFSCALHLPEEAKAQIIQPGSPEERIAELEQLITDVADVLGAFPQREPLLARAEYLYDVSKRAIDALFALSSPLRDAAKTGLLSRMDELPRPFYEIVDDVIGGPVVSSSEVKEK